MDIDEAITKAAETTGYENNLGSTDTVRLGAEPPKPAEPVQSELPITEPAKPETDEAKARDEAGRFKAKTEAKPAEGKPEAPKGGAPDAAKAPPGLGAAAVSPPKPAAAPAVPPGPSQLPADKAPANWRPVAREHWAAMPLEARQEWSRREKEMAAYVQRTEDDRKLVGKVKESLSPYDGVARANGMSTMDYAGSVLQSAQVLQMGTPAQRAQLIATLISTYGVPEDHIRAALDGAAGPTAQPPVDVRGEIQKALQAQREADRQQSADAKFAEFKASEPEFLEDVWPEMVDLAQSWARQGKPLDYPKLYAQACKINDGVASILTQRDAAKAAESRTATTQQARAAAATSIRSTPAPAVAQAQGNGWDEAIAHAREKHGM